jgi:exocyst complex component 4
MVLIEQGNFRLESEALEPDPDISNLNTHLMESDEVTLRTLSEDDRT